MTEFWRVKRRVVSVEMTEFLAGEKARCSGRENQDAG